jgi:hypothetical protein
VYTFPVRPRTMKRLAELAQPNVVPGGQSEALAWQLYDTQLYTSATTTQLTFFAAAPANKFLGNVVSNGLPTPQYFEVYFFGLDILRVPGNTDVWGDLWRIVNGTGPATLVGTPTWTFTLADKQMGPFPLRGLHGLGGPTGFSTRTSTEYANNGGIDNSFSVDGALVIPPTQSFQVDLRWPAAVTLSGNVQLQVWMAGVLHRRVL